MKGMKIFAYSLAGILLAATSALLPVDSFASDGYRSATNVTAGYRGHGDYNRGRGDRDGYRHHDRYEHTYRHHRPYGHAYGYWPRYSTTYYYGPAYRSYYVPRYYDGGRSGWDIDLRYHFSD